jgi:hypothetical protein
LELFSLLVGRIRCNSFLLWSEDCILGFGYLSIYYYFQVKPESKFWNSIKQNMPDIHWTRIESWALPGVPDCYGCKDGVMFWLELKTSTKVNKAKLSPFQKSWHFSHARQGGRSFIMHQILGERLMCIFSSSIVPSIGALSPKHASKCWALPASPAAWQEIQDYILHSPLQKPAIPEA